MNPDDKTFIHSITWHKPISCKTIIGHITPLTDDAALGGTHLHLLHYYGKTPFRIIHV